MFKCLEYVCVFCLINTISISILYAGCPLDSYPPKKEKKSEKMKFFSKKWKKINENVPKNSKKCQKH